MDGLVTERLQLRRLQTGDAPFILTLLNDPAFLQFIGDRGVRTIEQARDYIVTGPMQSYAAFGFGLLLVQLKNGSTPIGMCGLLKRDYLADPDIGFAYLPAYCAQGYAHEAASAVIHYASNSLHLGRVLAITQADNPSSIKLLTKLGFIANGHVRPSADDKELLVLARDNR